MKIAKPFFAYRSFRKEPDTVKRMYGLGIRQFCVFPANTENSVGLPYSEYPPNRVYHDVTDYTPVDRQIADILQRAPEAELLFMVDLNTPLWLIRKLAPELADSIMGLTDALSCERWKEDTLKYMRGMLEYIEAHYPGRVTGYILACGMTDEWMDYSSGRELPGKLAMYRKWSAARGFGEPERIPSVDERFRADPETGLRDPEKDRESLRYWRFLSELVADSIAEFAREARRVIPASTALGCFFGYVFELARRRLVQSGHLAYEKVFNCRDLDFFLCPGDYSDRQMGGGSGFMYPEGTLELAGKNPFYEIDHAVSTANFRLTPQIELKWMSKQKWRNAAEDVAGFRREFSRALIRGASLWWFDMWGGYFDRPEVVAEVAKMLDIHTRFSDAGRVPDAEIALVACPDSIRCIDDNRPDGFVKLNNSLLTLCSRLGAPVRTFSFNDLVRIPDLGRYRMVIFSGLFEVTPEKAALLRKLVLKNERIVIWAGGAAYSDGERRTPDGMEKLTGIPAGGAQCVRREMDGWTSCFIPDAEPPRERELRRFARDAGVHVFADFPAVVLASKDLLMIHTTETGRRTIRLKRPARPETLLGKPLQLGECTSFEYDFTGPETLLLHLG